MYAPIPRCIMKHNMCMYEKHICYLKPVFHCDAKPFTLGPGVGLDQQRHNFVLGIPTWWYLKLSKNVKICVTPTRNIKFALPPTQKPNASQWNIGCVGSPAVSPAVFLLRTVVDAKRVSMAKLNEKTPN